MRTGVALLLLMSIALGSGTAVADKGFTEGSAPLGMDLSPSAETNELGHWVLAIRTWGRDGLGSGKASVRIEVSGGAEVIEGQTECVIPARSGFWRLELRKTTQHPVLVTGSLRIDGGKPDHYFETRDILEVGYEGRNLVVRQKRTAVSIKAEGGRRFRYGETYLVALDPGESPEIPEFLSRPEVISSGDIRCKKCPIQEPVEILVTVTVGRNGSVTWLRHHPHFPSVDGRIWRAITTGIKKHRFKPAMGRNGPTSDSMDLPLRVVP